MGGNMTIPIPCACVRKPKSFIPQTKKFKNLNLKTKENILSFLGYEKQVYDVLLFNKFLRKEFSIENYDGTYFKIMKFLNRRLKNKMINFEKKIEPILINLKKYFKLENIAFATAIFLLNNREKQLRNFDNSDFKYDFGIDVKINEKDDAFVQFYNEFTHHFLKISTFLFSQQTPLYIKLVLNNDGLDITKNFTNFLSSIQNLKIYIDLIIPQQFCYSSLSILSASRNTLIINSLVIEKASLYIYGLNMIEKKFETTSTLNFLNIEETSSLEGEDKTESEIYDLINIDILKNIVDLNRKSLKEITLSTYSYINIISDKFFKSVLNCSNINKIDLKCKITKFDVEILKALLKLNLNYFDIDVGFIKKEDFLEQEIIKLMLDFILKEKMLKFPFCEKLLLSPEICNFNILSKLISESDSHELKLDFNENLMDLFFNDKDKNVEVCSESYERNIRDIINFISLNYCKKLKIYHSKKYSDYIQKFVEDIFFEMKSKKKDDFQIEEFHLYYDGDEIEVLFDNIFEYFTNSQTIKNITIERKKESGGKHFNVVNIYPYLKLEFSSNLSNKWIQMIEILAENNNENQFLNCIDLHFHIENEYFISNFPNFISTLSEVVSANRIIIKTFSCDPQDISQLNDKNLSIFLIFMTNLKILDSFYFTKNLNENKQLMALSQLPNDVINLFLSLSDLRCFSSFSQHISLHEVRSIIDNIKSRTFESLNLTGIEINKSQFEDLLKILSSKSLSNLKLLKLKFLDICDGKRLSDTILKHLKKMEEVKIFYRESDSEVNILARNNYQKFIYILKQIK